MKKSEGEFTNFIMMRRDKPEWLKQSPNAFVLLIEFACRARRTPGEVGWKGERIFLGSRQFIAGRNKVSYEIGLTEAEYRSAYKKLEKNDLIKTIKTTNRYTIGELHADDILNINIEPEQPTEQPTIQPSDNPQIATNNNGNNDDNKDNKLARSDNSFKKTRVSTEFPELEPYTQALFEERARENKILNPGSYKKKLWFEISAEYAEILSIFKKKEELEENIPGLDSTTVFVRSNNITDEINKHPAELVKIAQKQFKEGYGM